MSFIAHFFTQLLLVSKSAHLSLAVESEYLVADAGCASGLNLMQMSEQVKSGSAAPVVQLSLSQNPEHCALTGIHVTQHCQT